MKTGKNSIEFREAGAAKGYRGHRILATLELENGGDLFIRE
jgi:hypothetical protein